MSFEIWRLDQISDITEYSPKKKSEYAITFPHNLSSKFIPANFWMEGGFYSQSYKHPDIGNLKPAVEIL